MAVNADTVVGQLVEPVEPDPREPLDFVTHVGADVAANTGAAQRSSSIGLALAVGILASLVLGSLVGWLGYRAYESQHAQQQRTVFLTAGREAALNLTTISFTEADQDVTRILDSANGAFRDDFQKRAPEFIQVVNQAQAKSEGTITEAGVESVEGDRGRILVAVSVKTTTATERDPQPRGWRMRIDVEQTDQGVKVSNVEFIA